MAYYYFLLSNFQSDEGGIFKLKTLFGRAFSGTTQFFYLMSFILENITIYRFKSKEWTEELPPLPPSEVLDPLLIDPLGRTRLKKLKTRPWTPGENKTQVCSIKANVFYRPWLGNLSFGL